MNPDAEILVEIRFPHEQKRLTCSTKLHEYIFEKSLAPQSRYHDSRVDSEARELTEKKKHMRLAIVRDLAQQIAEKLIDLCEKEDPKMGYSPKEWEAMQ